MFMIHPGQYLVCAQEDLLGESSFLAIERNVVVILDELCVDPLGKSLRDVVLIRRCRGGCRCCRSGCWRQYGCRQSCLVFGSGLATQHLPLCYNSVDVLAAEVVVVALVGELALQLLHEVRDRRVILEVDGYCTGGDDLDRSQVLHHWVGGEVYPCFCCRGGQVGVDGHHCGRVR